jgi:hypothetical protein
VGKQELSARYGAQVSEGKSETEILLAHRKTKTRREILWAAWGNTGRKRNLAGKIELSEQDKHD